MRGSGILKQFPSGLNSSIAGLEPIPGIDDLPSSKSQVGIGMAKRQGSPSLSGSSVGSKNKRRPKVNLNLSVSGSSSYTPMIRVGGVHSSTDSISLIGGKTGNGTTN